MEAGASCSRMSQCCVHHGGQTYSAARIVGCTVDGDEEASSTASWDRRDVGSTSHWNWRAQTLGYDCMS